MYILNLIRAYINNFNVSTRCNFQIHKPGQVPLTGKKTQIHPPRQKSRRYPPGKNQPPLRVRPRNLKNVQHPLQGEGNRQELPINLVKKTTEKGKPSCSLKNMEN